MGRLFLLFYFIAVQKENVKAALCLVVDINLSFHLPDFSTFFVKTVSVCTVKGSSMDTLVKIREERQNTSHSLCPEIR